MAVYPQVILSQYVQKVSFEHIASELAVYPQSNKQLGLFAPKMSDLAVYPQVTPAFLTNLSFGHPHSES